MTTDLTWVRARSWPDSRIGLILTCDIDSVELGGGVDWKIGDWAADIQVLVGWLSVGFASAGIIFSLSCALVKLAVAANRGAAENAPLLSPATHKWAYFGWGPERVAPPKVSYPDIFMKP